MGAVYFGGWEHSADLAHEDAESEEIRLEGDHMRGSSGGVSESEKLLGREEAKSLFGLCQLVARLGAEYGMRYFEQFGPFVVVYGIERNITVAFYIVLLKLCQSLHDILYHLDDFAGWEQLVIAHSGQHQAPQPRPCFIHEYRGVQAVDVSINEGRLLYPLHKAALELVAGPLHTEGRVVWQGTIVTHQT